ncbi:MAG: radical SAM protein [Calditrichia bacterium]
MSYQLFITIMSFQFINACKILSSYALSRLTGKYFVWGKPYTFIIEPTAICNLRCPQCPVGLKTLLRPQDNMTFAEYKVVIDEIADHTGSVVVFQGESFINPEIIDMIDYAYDKGIFTVISTNGTRLANPEFAEALAASKLGRLILSVDGATEETYKIYRQAWTFSPGNPGIFKFMASRATGEDVPKSRFAIYCNATQ